MLAGIAVRTGVLQAPDFWEHVVNLRSNIVTMKQPNGAANFQDIEMYHWRGNFKPVKFYVVTASDAMKGLIIAGVMRASFRLSAKPGCRSDDQRIQQA